MHVWWWKCITVNAPTLTFYPHYIQSLTFLYSPSYLSICFSHISLSTGRMVIAVAAGTKHVVALTAPHGDPWALTNRHLLPSGDRDDTESPPPPHADMVIVVDPDSSSSLCGAAEFPCHTMMVAARSTYLRGYLRACSRGKGRFRIICLRVMPPKPYCSNPNRHMISFKRVTLLLQQLVP